MILLLRRIFCQKLMLIEEGEEVVVANRTRVATSNAPSGNAVPARGRGRRGHGRGRGAAAIALEEAQPIDTEAALVTAQETSDEEAVDRDGERVDQERRDGEAAMNAPYLEGDIHAPCVICDARKGTLAAKCGHLYCPGCYYGLWKSKENEYNLNPRRGLYGQALIRYGYIPFNRKEVECTK